jgi:hypothetical protein
MTGGLTPRWSQRRLPLEFMHGLGYTTFIELAEPLHRVVAKRRRIARLSRRSHLPRRNRVEMGAKTDRRGSALDR